MKHFIGVIFFFFSLPLWGGEQDLLKVKKEMIRKSIGSYSGVCGCPYQLTRRGRKCGKRSAYSRKGGAIVLCYESDISNEQVKNFLSSKGR